MRGFFVLGSVLLVLAAGCSGSDEAGSSLAEEPFNAQEVLAAFSSSGIDLVSQRLGELPCDPPRGVGVVTSLGCDEFVVTADDVVKDVDDPGDLPLEFPRVILNSEKSGERWVVYIYANEDIAQAVATRSDATSPMTGEPFMFERARNVVVAYLDADDGPQIRGWLTHLSSS